MLNGVDVKAISYTEHKKKKKKKKKNLWNDTIQSSSSWMVVEKRESEGDEAIRKGAMPSPGLHIF
jgi:hypothetical protein